MKKISEFKGINGKLIAFKEEVKNAKKVTFSELQEYVLHMQNFLPTLLGIKNLYSLH
jgi:hypothetical protein